MPSAGLCSTLATDGNGGYGGNGPFKNWEEVENIRRPLGEPQGIDERILLRELLRRVEMKFDQRSGSSTPLTRRGD